jgi:hypothetical protein
LQIFWCSGVSPRFPPIPCLLSPLPSPLLILADALTTIYHQSYPVPSRPLPIQLSWCVIRWRGGLLNIQTDFVLCFPPSADHDDVVSLSSCSAGREVLRRGEKGRKGVERRGEDIETLGLNFSLPFLAPGIRGKSSPSGSQLGSFPLLCAHH